MYRCLALLACLPACAAVVEDGEHVDDDMTQLMEEAYEHQDDTVFDDGCSGVKVPDRSGFAKRVVLTFDDGPNPATTPTVIETLHRHHAPATFFINGSRLATSGAPELAAQIAADPDFILANHSQNHRNLATVSASTFASEVDRTTDLIVAAGETPKYFRFPFGSATCAYAAGVRQRRYIVTGWHIDSADWCFATTGGARCPESTFRYVPDQYRSDMRGYILSQVREMNGGILLMHDIHRSSADALDGILTALEAEGFTFVRLDDASMLPVLNGAPPPPRTWIGDACSTDAQCTFAGGFCVEDGAGGGVCTQACTSTCPDMGGYPLTRCVAAPSPDDPGQTTNLCTVSCTAGQCRAGLSCQTLTRPTGASADVCWLE
jgi:peptidoglycan/xylan/chitin deacetylase (PgdA/CDA1 family)